MRRILVALALVACLGAAVAQAQTPLSVLDLGPIFAIKTVELDGRPGREFLVQIRHFLVNEWMVVYPQHPKGICKAGPIALNTNEPIDDFDGDGTQEILQFDFSSQTVSFKPFPVCVDHMAFMRPPPT